MSVDPSITLAARILLVLVFGAAVLGKLRHRDEFMGVVANYRLLPQGFAIPVAWLVIALELLVVLSLGSGIALLAGTVLAVGLLCAFGVAITINLARGRRDIDCGCFRSALRQRLSLALVVRNVLLSASALPLLAQSAQLEPFSPGVGIQTYGLLQAIDGIGAGVVLFILYQFFGQALALKDAGEALHKRLT